MTQNENIKEIKALSDDFLGQVSGGKQNFSLEDQNALKNAIENEIKRGGNFDLNKKIFQNKKI